VLITPIAPIAPVTATVVSAITTIPAPAPGPFPTPAPAPEPFPTPTPAPGPPAPSGRGRALTSGPLPRGRRPARGTRRHGWLGLGPAPHFLRKRRGRGHGCIVSLYISKPSPLGVRGMLKQFVNVCHGFVFILEIFFCYVTAHPGYSKRTTLFSTSLEQSKGAL